MEYLPLQVAEIDAVVVSTPDHTHAHIALDAMRRGKHCYCEKPMAVSVEDARRMRDAAAAARGMAYVPQEQGVFPTLTVLENLRVGGLLGVRPEEELMAEDLALEPGWGHHWDPSRAAHARAGSICFHS